MKHRAVAYLVVSGLLLAAAGCSDDGEDGAVEPNLVGASGVTIREIAIYQGLKRTLVLDGAPGQATTVPLIAGRDAVIRVFYATDGGYDGKEVTGRLEIDGADPIEAKTTLVASSADGDMASTVNFVIPGASIGTSFTYSLGLLQEGADGDDNGAARWPASGQETVAVEGAANKLRIILAPFQYNADGSGRLPDTSPEAVERYRQRFKALYPVSDVEVTVREATPWSGAIGPDGSGWQEVGFTVFGFRAQDGTPDDVYYYGIFNPRDSFNQYCGNGCLLGVTLLNSDPPDTGDVRLRLALGVGFEEYARDTAAHEVGHAHGREHADCGPGLDPQSIDSAFPHDGGQIGVWGLDAATLQLYPPETTDIMGYCDNQWISDYNFTALLNRGKNVNLPKWHEGTGEAMDPRMQAARKPVLLIGVDGEGRTSWGGFSTASDEIRGTPVPANVVHVDGSRTQAKARYFPYDHLPGGWVLVSDATEDTSRIELDIDGSRLTAEPGSSAATP